MKNLKQFFDFIFSRSTLALVGLMLLVSVIWFVGPLLAIDGLRPLASVAVRVVLILLVVMLGVLWLVDGPLSLVGVALSCLLVGQVGPMLSLGNVQPLAPLWVRAVLIGAILVVCALYWLQRLIRKVKTEPNFLANYFADKGASQENPAKEEIRDVTSKVSRAIAQLRALRTGGGLRKLLEGKRYLYELPWYMVVGNSGGGKTTALLNSGLQFPVAQQMGNAPRRMAFGADGGTMQCEWWFTNEAVLIDTAGRYTAQESAAKDSAEWRGFLGVLRKHRTRAPINGVIVTLNAAELIQLDGAARIEQGASIRHRLAELRSELGIRFPVYVMVTKLDLLSGFNEYFQSLTSEGRTQVLGFTLKEQSAKALHVNEIAGHREALREQIGIELALLKERLENGALSRINDEFETDKRRRLLGLHQEFAALSVPLAQMLDEMFLDSRFDSTQLYNTLRGVYFTSAGQAHVSLAAEPDTLVQRLWRSMGLPSSGEGIPDIAAAATATATVARPVKSAESGAVDQSPSEATTSRPAISNPLPTYAQQGFFLQELLTKVIIPEAHLMRPNLRWEWRFRLLRALGHTLAVGAFVGLASALMLSFGHNRQYLQVVGERAQALGVQVGALLADFKPAGVSDVLNSARELPLYAGLDVEQPPLGFLYGLYSVPPVLEASAETYARLQDHLLVPPIVQRIEAVLTQSVKDRDANTAYATLRVYKLLHDPAHYLAKGGAADVRHWVLKDWETSDSAAAFGGRASMVGHVQALFSGARPVQSAALPNEALVREVQGFLDSHSSTQRVYERAKAALAGEAPQEFTLIRAVGPQAGTVFARAGSLPLEKGVPGLFTYDGYHELFNPRLAEFVARALEDDAWVMGRQTSGLPKKALDEAANALHTDPLLEDIRRQYLNEYAQHWDDFLNSIRTVGGVGGEGGGTAAGTSLGFDLTVLRQFAAPDSPLARLARAAARETTLSRPLVTPTAAQDKGFLDKAGDELSKQTQELQRNLGIRREERLEKQLVDNRFAALREVVTGQPDVQLASASGLGGARPGLETISGLVNEFYTLLVVADTALTAGSLAPGGTEIGAKLKLEAGKLPAPFREVLSALATSGADKVVQGSTDILHKQAQVQFDRLMGLMAMQVSDGCKRGIEGRYPFVAASAAAQDASIEDVTQVFAVGGSADEYFTKYLAPFVDTSVRPWRYKNSSSANAMVGAETWAAGTPPASATTGPTLVGELLKLLAQGGPNLDAFYRAKQIRELFFRDAGGKKLAWKMEMKVLDLDPTITDLVIDIDGQGQRYIHGPVQAFAVNWPGPRGGSTADLIANPKISASTSAVQVSGPWALFRLMDKGRVVTTATSGRVSVEFAFDGRKALLDVSAGTQPNPLNSDVLRGFRCPGAAA